MIGKNKLIINADDYGYTMGVTYGILHAHLQGIVTSTTALTVSNNFKRSIEIAKKFPSLKIGVHLTLTAKNSKPLLREKVSTLTDVDGCFWSLSDFLHKVNIEEVEKEWEAQIEEFFDTGMEPTHLDSHHNVHGASNELLDLALKIAEKYDLPLRNSVRNSTNKNNLKYHGVKTTNTMFGEFYDDHVTLDKLKEITTEINNHDNETFEMNCHPGFVDNELLLNSSYTKERLKEIDILTSEKAKNVIEKSNIELVAYDYFK